MSLHAAEKRTTRDGKPGSSFFDSGKLSDKFVPHYDKVFSSQSFIKLIFRKKSVINFIELLSNTIIVCIFPILCRAEVKAMIMEF